MKHRGFLLTFALALLVGANVLTIFGQSVRGRIEGTVKDASGAVVPGAIVLVRNNQTNLSRSIFG